MGKAESTTKEVKQMYIVKMGFAGFSPHVPAACTAFLCPSSINFKH